MNEPQINIEIDSNVIAVPFDRTGLNEIINDSVQAFESLCNQQTELMFQLELNIDIKRYFEKSKQYEKIISKYANKYDLPIRLIESVIQVESNWHEDAISSEQCIGLCQIHKGLKEADENIHAGCSILRDRLNRYRTIERALAAYNGTLGSGSKYANKVIKVWLFLEILNK